MDKTVFAGGCFWGVQYYFDQVPGVISTTAGYSGGNKPNPTYEEVCSGQTGHVEAVEVVFNSKLISFEDLLKHFFLIHDPTRSDGQGLDIGSNYRPVIFYNNEAQKTAAEKYIKYLEDTKKYNSPIKTGLEKLGAFWPAEDYHQKYAQKTGRGMCHVDYRPLA